MESLFSHTNGFVSPPPDTARPSEETALRPPAAQERTSPTDRASLRRQWQLVLAGALASGEHRCVVSSTDLTQQQELTGETVAQTLRFCCEAGLFKSVGRGKFTVTQAGWDVARCWQEDETYARLLLQGVFRSHWSVPVADAALRSGPVSAEKLGGQLLGDLPGKPRRGTYLVEWLALALLVHRDQRGMVWPTPALRTAVASQVAALPAAAPENAPAEASGQELDVLMGMTNRRLNELDKQDPDRFRAFVDNLTQLVASLPA